MPKKYKITYRAKIKSYTVIMEAFSKYDAKQRFYRTYPKYEVITIEEVSGDDER